MAKTENAALRNALIAKIETTTGLKMKRSATATAGLSVSNKDMKLNGFAHLLCNQKNYPIVEWLIHNQPEIPERFQNRFDEVSFMYACGSSPRIISNVNRHKSKDAAMTGLPQDFIQWAQSYRILVTETNHVGTSRSVKTGVRDTIVDDNGDEIRVYKDPNSMGEEDLVGKAIAEQQQMADVLRAGGVQAAKTLAACEEFNKVSLQLLLSGFQKKPVAPKVELKVEPMVVETPKVELKVEPMVVAMFQNDRDIINGHYWEMEEAKAPAVKAPKKIKTVKADAKPAPKVAAKRQRKAV